MKKFFPYLKYSGITLAILVGVLIYLQAYIFPGVVPAP